MNSLNLKYKRLKMVISRERRRGLSVCRIIFFYVPLKLLSKSYAEFAALINEVFINKLLNMPRFRNFQNSAGNSLNNHFYVIVMPNILHFLNPCLKLIPENINVFLILNGTRTWEENYLRENYPDYPVFKLTLFPCSSLSHGSVLNLLIENNESNFGIIDHDLYIFNKEIFNELVFKKEESVIGAFRLINRKSLLVFPATHFMFFNISLIKKLRGRYKIGAQVYTRIPSRLKKKLAIINLGYHNFLKDYLYYFDTFNMILAMAFYEERSARILNLDHEDIYHLGGTSYATDNLYRTYINLKLLEMPQNSSIKQKYSFLCSKFTSSDDVLECFPKTASSFEFVERIDTLIRKIEQS